jgi:uncharacterized protein (DUF4415 family)
MNGLKMTLMSSKEMKVLRDHQLSKTDLTYLHHANLSQIEPEDDEESPDASILMRQELEKRRVDHPAGTANKEQVAIRLDKDILSAFRATGAGWQTRMNDVLKKWLNSHSTI